MIRLHLIIRGKVQGVYFRASTAEQARALPGVTGWVRNRPDGAVEVMAEGSRAQLELLLTWCHHGPPAARVDHCEVTWHEAAGAWRAFTITHAADDDPHGPNGER